MKIDRSKFLLLTSAMFACGTKSDPSAPSGPIVIPAQPPATASMSPPPTARLAELIAAVRGVASSPPVC